MYGIAWEHRPEPREFITSSAEFWKRWIRVSWYYNRVYLMSIEYAFNTCFV